MKLLGVKHSQKVLRRLHSKGIELTPDQLKAETKRILDKVRQGMAEKGHIVPDVDEELLRLIREAVGRD